MELLKLLSTSEIVAQILGFLLLFFLLRAFAWKRLLALLDERKARISSEFQKIEETKAALERIKTDYESAIFIQTHDFLSHPLPPYDGGRLGWGWTL